MEIITYCRERFNFELPSVILARHTTVYFWINCVTATQGRRHGFESGGGQILRAERAEIFFLTPHFLASGGDKILLT